MQKNGNMLMGQTNLQYVNNRLVDLYSKIPHLSREELQHAIGFELVDILEADALSWCISPNIETQVQLYGYNTNALDLSLLASNSLYCDNKELNTICEKGCSFSHVKPNIYGVTFKANAHTYKHAVLFSSHLSESQKRRFYLFFPHIEQMLNLNMSLHHFSASFYLITNREGVVLESSHPLEQGFLKHSENGLKMVRPQKLFEAGFSLLIENEQQCIYGFTSGFLAKLTYQERVIVNKVRNGMTNQKIAQQLNISASTVNNHLTNIYRKLNISKRTQLFAL